jgi:hypothetical protein
MPFIGISMEASKGFPDLQQDRMQTKNKDIDGGGGDFYGEVRFLKMLDLEFKRARRSRQPFILVLIHMNSGFSNGAGDWQKAVASGFRETDIRGWYRQDSVIGIAFTELRSVGDDTRASLFGKLLDALASQVEPDDLRKMYITFHTYPSSREDAVPCGRFDLAHYPAPAYQIAGTQFLPRMKKLMKATGPLAALLKFLPIFFSYPASKT